MTIKIGIRLAVMQRLPTACPEPLYISGLQHGCQKYCCFIAAFVKRSVASASALAFSDPLRKICLT